MTIRFRLFTFIIILSALLIGVSYFATFITMDILSKTEHIFSDQFKAMDALLEVNRNTHMADHSMSTILLGGYGESDAAQLSDFLKKTLDGYDSFSADYKQVLDETWNSDNLKQLISRWSDTADSIKDQMAGGTKAANLSTERETYDKAFAEMQKGFDALRQNLSDQAASNYKGVRKFGFSLFVTYHIIAATGGLLGIFILLTIYRSVLKPIKKVSRQVQELASGEGDLTRRIPVIGNDEMSQLAVNLNNFIGKTEGILKILRSSIKNANSVKEGTISSISENGTATTQISSNIQSIAGQITSMETQVREADQSVNRLNSSVGLYEDQVLDQAAMVEETTASVTEMISSIANLSTIAKGRKEGTEALGVKIREGDSRIRESVSTVQNIHGAVDAILDMVKMIAGIASKTNLLAMNAAIEAAHAGDAGRGFAVVADEIRKLAETSSEQSKSISTVLSETVKNINYAVEASSFTLRMYSEIQSEFKVLIDAFSEISSNSGELDAGGKQILETMEKLNGGSQRLRDESGELKKVNSEMVAVMANLSEISYSINSSIGEINGGMKDIAEGISVMENLSKDLDQSMVSADEQLNRFKLSI